MSLVTGIILLIVGIILAACKGYTPHPVSLIMLIGGIILAIVGIVLILTGALGYPLLLLT